jgi:sugar phosphate isomerase/epimerase
MISLTRRNFAAALAAPLLVAAGKPIRLGGPIFLKSSDPRELALEHRRLGYSVIAEVGAWVNMLDPDPDKRGKNLRYVTGRLALAEAVGARCCPDIAGSYNPTVWYGPHPKNLSQEFFDATVQNCRRVIDEVKPKRTKFTIEMMGWSLPDGPDAYLKLIRAVDRPGFAVHMDVCNGINSPAKFYRSGEFISDCFRTLGPWIVSCHAKDLQWVTELNVHFLEVVPGRGEVDYRTYLTELSKLPIEAPLMLEHLKTAEEYDEGKRYIMKVGSELGLAFA